MSNTNKTSQKKLQINQNNEHHTSISDAKDDFDEWKRLEKWEIGRRNFC